ncbi:hypothetical protein [Streptomyces acidicola]|uniref:Uncharacterized protein n=1 Tax=Streptomyces acidicola TaxID=2596892 RepID=A0A5N8X5T2_9ACTN|nr:hypothetical protein [Streptomyces acidicola]MPY54827.1 hypothetical protein [Streptomyces acidicola]
MMCTDIRRHRGGRVLARLAAAAVAALVLTGCAEQARSVESVRTEDSRATATADSSAAGLRKDEEPVRVRFPEFGDFSSVV